MNKILNVIFKGKVEFQRNLIVNQYSLFSVKQVAYSTYTDVKHRSYILMKHNIEKIKVLDLDIDLASSYFLLPEQGVYRE